MSKIILDPLLGLANRLRVIESGLSLAKELESQVQVIWRPNAQMVASYLDLFEPPLEFQLLEKNAYFLARSSFSLKGLKKGVGRIINTAYGLDVVFSDSDVKHKIWRGEIDLLKDYQSQNLYFSTCRHFYSFSYQYSWLSPLPSLLNKVNQLIPEKNSSAIGLHIRRTDHSHAVKNSPDSLFLDIIRRHLKYNKQAHFFLSTDSPEVEEKFSRLFGNQIFFQEKRFGRDSVVATQDALVDLLCLSRCGRIYGSQLSSFSETAAAIGKKKLYYEFQEIKP